MSMASNRYPVMAYGPQPNASNRNPDAEESLIAELEALLPAVVVAADYDGAQMAVQQVHPSAEGNAELQRRLHELEAELAKKEQEIDAMQSLMTKTSVKAALH